MRDPGNQCEELSSPGYVNFGISIFILLGILVSYLPQHIRIIARRSSQGISPYFVLLGTTSGTCAFANIITQPASRADLACCRDVSGFECFAGLLGVAQVGVQWACFWFILLLFLIFFPRATSHKPLSQHAPTYRLALSITLICLLHLLFTVMVTIAIWYFTPARLSILAAVLGIVGTLLAAVQFLPQIYTTWQLQEIGSLSIPMMCIQTPGSFVWVGSLAARLGWPGWSTWGIYLVTGCLQGMLLIMAISFEIRDRREKRQKVAILQPNGYANEARQENEQHDETTRLLQDER